MDLFEILQESLTALTINKLRTGLATLGIIIGIGSVIALVSLGESSQAAVTNQIQSLGANLLTIIPGTQNSGGVRGAGGGGTTLTLDDALAIKNSNQVTTISQVSPEFSRRTQIKNGKNNTNTQIIGVTPAYQLVRKITLVQGEFIGQRDIDNQTRVAVLGPQVVTDLFGNNTNPLSQTIRINNQAFRVIGVTQSKGGTGFQNQDDLVFVPLTTAQKQLFDVNYLSTISLEAKNQELMTQAQDQVGYLLLSRHKLNNPAQADFTIFSQNDILNTASSITGTFTALLSGIAAISLLVGGIGIMNIMLVTVTERTREIGLRKALGAKKKLIIAQFLIEAIFLTFAGGIIGMILGTITSFLISKIINLPFVISSVSVVLAIFVSAVIGIVFGLYPARKAANLQPIEALRYE